MEQEQPHLLHQEPKRTSCQSQWPGPLHWLAKARWLQGHHSRFLAQMFRMWKNGSWCSEMWLSVGNLTQSPRTITMHIGLLYKRLVSSTDILIFSITYNSALMPTYPKLLHHLPLLTDLQQSAAEFSNILQAKFEKKRYIGPISYNEVIQFIGPFQSSCFNLVPKIGKPEKFCLIQNLSYPHSPNNNISSINSIINSDLFLCTWSIFFIISLLISHLPPGSKGAVPDVKKAYQTIPLAPSQWPGMIVQINKTSFAIDTHTAFSLASAGCYGTAI